MEIAAASSSTWNADSGLFMKLLIAQLQNQNPMDPMSNSEMITQMSQLTAVDGIRQLNDNFADILELYKLTSGTGLLGKQVEYEHEGGTFSGLVEAVSTRDSTLKLTVNGIEVPLSKVSKIL
ncbi:unnamed protein product [marine sediment metagenome]|uniref:FlgD Tudor-like domain-containing protein n=1 Tax=marine sediment metagenome TaxID=412755 RepID=X0RV68_9ZZZZ